MGAAFLTITVLHHPLSWGLTLVIGMSASLGLGQLPSSGSAPTPKPALVTPRTDASPGKGAWPLSPRPRVVRGFAPPSVRWKAGHRGVDLSGRAGRAVLNAKAGTVTFAGKIAGKGVVVVDIGSGLRVTYEPVAASVKVGQKVKTGQPLGSLLLGQSHCFPGACLHWGLIRGERYLNPLQLVGYLPVRLLPLP
ncbi:MAG: peptidoglycan DD-metalloendopeptidase family protein [Nocardioidaceae bacterium]|nr:M23 family metallopeptidase [Nocardioidaceae bacterium]HMY08320.1 peptidoglycan DD-metalloendopeptidase family protein [Marmoricola sp.]